MATRNRLTSLFDLTATHERPTFTADTSGGAVRAWATQTASVKCARWPATSEIQDRYAQRQIVVTHQICCGSDIGARSGDRMVIGSTNYLVKGAAYYANEAVAAETPYVIDVEEIR